MTVIMIICLSLWTTSVSTNAHMNQRAILPPSTLRLGRNYISSRCLLLHCPTPESARDLRVICPFQHQPITAGCETKTGCAVVHGSEIALYPEQFERSPLPNQGIRDVKGVKAGLAILYTTKVILYDPNAQLIVSSYDIQSSAGKISSHLDSNTVAIPSASKLTLLNLKTGLTLDLPLLKFASVRFISPHLLSQTVEGHSRLYAETESGWRLYAAAQADDWDDTFHPSQGLYIAAGRAITSPHPEPVNEKGEIVGLFKTGFVTESGNIGSLQGSSTATAIQQIISTPSGGDLTLTQSGDVFDWRDNVILREVKEIKQGRHSQAYAIHLSGVISVLTYQAEAWSSSDIPRLRGDILSSNSAFITYHDSHAKIHPKLRLKIEKPESVEMAPDGLTLLTVYKDRVVLYSTSSADLLFSALREEEDLSNSVSSLSTAAGNSVYSFVSKQGFIALLIPRPWRVMQLESYPEISTLRMHAAGIDVAIGSLFLRIWTSLIFANWHFGVGLCFAVPQDIELILLEERRDLLIKILLSLESLIETPGTWSDMHWSEYLASINTSTVKTIFDPRREGALLSSEEISFRLRRLERILISGHLSNVSFQTQLELVKIARYVLENEEHPHNLDAMGRRFMCPVNAETHEPVTDYCKVVWAYHSESQQYIISKMKLVMNRISLESAKRHGIFLWLKDRATVTTIMEDIAKQQFTSQDLRDPTMCSLFYICLRKKKLLHTMWRQAGWHPEQQNMLKFLANDFTQPRWKTAAMKNAFALLSKRRFEYAAAFFLLGDSLKDAVNVCLRQLNDWHLAIAVARVYETDDKGPVLRSILTEHVIPLAISQNSRWLAVWAFWSLDRKDLSIRACIHPLSDLGNALPCEVKANSTFDSSLAILFAEIKQHSLQTIRGLAHITEKEEYDFVLRTAQSLRDKGCEKLALAILRTWEFTPAIDPTSETPHSPTTRTSVLARSLSLKSFQESPRRSSFDLHRRPVMPHRRMSVSIDLTLDEIPPSQTETPAELVAEEVKERVKVDEEDEGEEEEERPKTPLRKGFGSLVKTAQKDSQVAEFDMSAFGF